jgi:ABC-2 type transport system ATP-binding protein
VTGAADQFGIVTRGLSKSFGAVTAVVDLDLEVRRGEVFGLLGPNGSGKTTTIRMLTGLVRPTAGQAIVAGIDVVTAPERVRQRIGYMSQRFGFYEDLTIEENIRFYGGVYGLIGRERTDRIAEQFARYRLGDRSRQLAGTLSGGWKQRLALACATVHRPDLVFLDEPTAGVDPASRRLFWEMIREHADLGMTIIVTTHYMDEAERCERLAFLSRGHLIGVGTPREITARFGLPTIEDVFIELQRRDEADANATA